MQHIQENIKEWIEQPNFNDPSKNFSSFYIQVISLTIVLGSSIIGIIYSVVGQPVYVGLILTTAITFGIVILLVRFRKLEFAAFLFILATLGQLTLGIFAGGGIHSLVSVLYPVILIFASLILDRRAFIFYCLLCVSSIGFVIYAENQNFSPVYIPDPPSLAMFITFSMLVIATAVIIHIITDSLKNNLLRVQLAEKQVRSQVTRIEVLASFSQLLTQTNQNYQQVVETVVRRCAELIGDGASILLYSPESEFLELAAVYNTNPKLIQIFKDEISARPIRADEGAYAHVISKIAPILIPSISIEALIEQCPPERREYYKNLPIYSLMLAPLHVQGKLIGVIGLARHTPNKNYIPEDLTFFQDIADRSALAMLNAQLYKELEQELGERKLAEKKYRNIFENAIIGIFQSTPDGHLLSVNPAMARMYGYTSPQEMVKSVTDVAEHIYLDPGSRDVLRERLEAGEEIREYEALEYRKDKSTLWTSMNAQVIRDKKGETLYYEGTVEDITLRKKIEAEQESLIQELASKNAELERFTYTVSHDLKSPLVTINGFLGYLKQDAIAGDIKRHTEDAQRVQDAVNKMHRLLGELLELSQIGRMMNEPQMLPFEELTREALEIVHGRLQARGITVQILSPQGTQPKLPDIYGDKPRLIEVMQNLLDNSAKYMGDQPNPLIEIGQFYDAKGESVFFVRDNGIGIAAKYHETIFGLFNKLDANSEGTGVGLALVKRIVEVHGGRIWVESEVGKGTTFCFHLKNKNIY